MTQTDIIRPEQAGTLAGLFRERVARTPDAVAYRQFDAGQGGWVDLTWHQAAAHVGRWQAALRRESLAAGDRVAIMLRNCREWVFFDQAALGLGLVPVPLYTTDRVGNVVHILKDSGARLLLIGNQAQWRELKQDPAHLAGLERIVSVESVADAADPRLVALADWLPAGEAELRTMAADPDALATLIYTSGTTGRPKGVMLSHANILGNAYGSTQMSTFYAEDLYLSFLPLSHAFERTAGYYMPMMLGSTVAYARSVEQLGEDLLSQRPTVLVSVPRIYERVHARISAQLAARPALARRLFHTAVAVGWRRFLYRQGRGGWHPSLLAWPLLEHLVAGKILDRLGGRLRIAVSGGAPLSTPIARTFIGLGLPLSQGYGLTEHSPVVSANPLEDNIPESVGRPLPEVELKIGDNQELLVRSGSVMLGYWNNPEQTAQVIQDGWLRTGDQARIDGGHLYIVGRSKDVIVLANGEKVPPADMEMAIAMDPLFEQVLVLGEGRPYLSALIVPNAEAWAAFAAGQKLEAGAPPRAEGAVQERLLARAGRQLQAFPGYARIHRLALLDEPWTIDNGLLTPTLKPRREQILERYHDEVERLYAGH
ncbi:MAG: long-chain fatty acid--CoA ligase [Pseudomonadota bacterium]|nr:long-chain fatty acid--CoA ligase [Pseudomonadota bacterium]